MSDKAKKLHAPTIKRLALELSAIAGQLAARAIPISAANDFADDGRKGIDYSAVRRGGNDATGPERAALTLSKNKQTGRMETREDDVGLLAGEFMDKLRQCHALACRLHTLGVKLGVEWNVDALKAAEGVARRSNESAGAGDCANCGRVVSGSSVDRLKEGRCEACYKYHQRNGSERPRHLWSGDSIDPVCVNIWTHHGIDHRCTLLVGHDGKCEFAGAMT